MSHAVDRIVEQLERGEEVGRQRAHEDVRARSRRTSSARPARRRSRTSCPRPSSAARWPRLWTASGSAARPRRASGAMIGSPSGARSLLARAGQREALEIALGDVDHVAAQIAHLPVAAGRLALPGRLVQQLVELRALGSIEIQQKLFAANSPTLTRPGMASVAIPVLLSRPAGCRCSVALSVHASIRQAYPYLACRPPIPAASRTPTRGRIHWGPGTLARSVSSRSWASATRSAFSSSPPAAWRPIRRWAAR